MFVDEIQIEVMAGKGGDGASTFRREKFVPQGGPNGGDGGKGGDVILRACANTNTLSHLRYQRRVRAKNGVPGAKNNMHGRQGEARYVDVPFGTMVYDAESGKLLADIGERMPEFVVAVGGRGGRGNARFATAKNQAPTFAEHGRRGEEKKLRLELKLLADVGLLGFPSVGKSTLIRAVSNAKPQVAAYHFTTLTPHLGVVEVGEYDTFVIADLPGLIVGAGEGKGLGHDFLKHLERTRFLLHMIEVPVPFDEAPIDRDPVSDFDKLNKELEIYEPSLAEKPQIVVLTKIDLDYVRAEIPRLKAYFNERHYTFFAVSAATGEGLKELIQFLAPLVLRKK